MSQQREHLEKYVQQFKEKPETAKVAPIVNATTKDNFTLLEKVRKFQRRRAVGNQANALDCETGSTAGSR